MLHMLIKIISLDCTTIITKDGTHNEKSTENKTKKEFGEKKHFVVIKCFIELNDNTPVQTVLILFILFHRIPLCFASLTQTPSIVLCLHFDRK